MDKLQALLIANIANNPEAMNQDVMLIIAYLADFEWYMLGYNFADIFYMVLTGNDDPNPPSPPSPPSSPDELHQITQW